MSNTPPQPFHDDDLFTIWETGAFVELDPMDVLGLAEDGKFPLPVQLWPLRWLDIHVRAWDTEQQEKTDVA